MPSCWGSGADHAAPAARGARDNHRWPDIITLSHPVARIASIPDLIRLKRLAGRPHDPADIEALEIILRRKAGPDAR